MILRITPWLSRLGRVHRVHLESAGAAVVRRPEGVRVAVVCVAVLPVRLQFVHATSADRKIIRDLPLHHRCFPVGSLQFSEVIREYRS